MSITIDGHEVLLTDEVHSVDHALRATIHHKRKPEDVKRIVFHWTAGPANKDPRKSVAQWNSKPKFKQRYGYHFCVWQPTAGYAEVVQFADPATDVVYHAGGHNMNSVGIAICAPGHNDALWKYTDDALGTSIIRHKIHGKSITYQSMPQLAVDAACEVAYRVCQVLGIPTLSPPPEVARSLTKKELDMYSVVNHYHLSKKKHDAGVQMMQNWNRLLTEKG